MENTIINREFLKGYKTIKIGLENFDTYLIDVEDILDICCEIKPISDRKEGYTTDNGFIKISSRAAQIVEHDSLKYQLDDIECPTHLKERFEMFDGGVDVTSFSLKSEDKGSMYVCVPYDPIVSVMNGREIELSNSSSFEIDNDGNMIIFFGNMSKQPRREDNNYHELVSGWEEAFGEYKPKVLKVTIYSCGTFGMKNNDVYCCFEIRGIQNKGCKAELLFFDCKDIAWSFEYTKNGDCEIVMTKMADGRIYVGFADLSAEFTCSQILESDYYNKQNEN